LRPGAAVIDLGAAPGGWAQVAAQKVGPKGVVVAVDLLGVAPLQGVACIRGDVREPAVQAAIDAALGSRRADLVLCDMAPNLTGIKPADEARSQELVELAIACAQRWLKPDGVALVKLFHGTGLDAVIRHMKQVFVEVAIRKPPASRAASAEVYALCRGLARRTHAADVASGLGIESVEPPDRAP
jgi:23S rRNA (uridine2552-2'-O)-methyltransferase